MAPKFQKGPDLKRFMVRFFLELKCNSIKSVFTGSEIVLYRARLGSNPVNGISEVSRPLLVSLKSINCATENSSFVSASIVYCNRIRD